MEEEKKEFGENRKSKNLTLKICKPTGVVEFGFRCGKKTKGKKRTR